MKQEVKKIGILGGGQLGRMFIQNALNYSNEIHILDPDSEASCSKIAHTFVQGNFNDFQTVLDFGKNVDVIGIEIEHVNVDALKELEKLGKTVVPRPSIIELFQDKGIQKEFYKNQSLATSEYYLIENSSEIDLNKINFPFVQKLRKGGYDGKGVQILKSEHDLEKLWNEPSVIEKCEEIDKELAVIFVKNNRNELAVFPVVEMIFDEELNLVDTLISPANIVVSIEEKVNQLIEKFSNVLDSAGIFAVEFFLTKSGDVLINETAPRVHNSGHHTIEANLLSQYEMMFRALLNLPFSSVKQKVKYAAMLNLIGEDKHNGKAYFENLEQVLGKKNVYIHSYGKAITKPGRKMGHVTFTGKSLEKINENINFVKENLKVISI